MRSPPYRNAMFHLGLTSPVTYRAYVLHDIAKDALADARRESIQSVDPVTTVFGLAAGGGTQPVLSCRLTVYSSEFRLLRDDLAARRRTGVRDVAGSSPGPAGRSRTERPARGRSRLRPGVAPAARRSSRGSLT